jgi:hypothetical protein
MPALMQAAVAVAIGVGLVLVDEVREPAAVGADDAVEAPLAHYDVAQHGVDVAGHAVPGVVCRHHRAGAAVSDRHLKGLGVILAPETLVEIRRRVEASVLVAVGEEVFQQARGLEGARIIAGEAACESRGKRAGEKGVLAINLLGAAPARIAGEVGVGRHDDEGRAPVFFALKQPARLVRLIGGDALQERGVPGRGETVSLRKLRGRRRVAFAPVARTALRHAVVTLGDIRPNHAETRHARRETQVADLFVERHAPDEIGDALFYRQVGIAERIIVGGGGCGGAQRQAGEEGKQTRFHGVAQG